MISLFVWPVAFDTSGMRGPAGNICYRQHGSQVHLNTQTPPLRQSRDTTGKGVVDIAKWNFSRLFGGEYVKNFLL